MRRTAEKPHTAIVHYSAPPVVGGVEAVIRAQAEELIGGGYPVMVVSGEGDPGALPEGVELIRIPELGSQNEMVLSISAALEAGRIPEEFESFTEHILALLEAALEGADSVIVHNVFTKHFNLPLTAALARFIERHAGIRFIAWCHDFTWTSAHSRPKVHEGYPWDLLRTRLAGVSYVTISERRRQELTKLFGCRSEEVLVVYNGVEAATLLGLSGRALELVERLGLLDCGLSLLMPVRVTQAKNIEYGIRLTAELKEREVDPRVVLTGPPDPHDADSMRYFDSLRELRSKLDVEREMRFVYESGEKPGEGLKIGMEVVAGLYRASDLLFMPSHREGFGMPILEAGLLGLPIVCTAVPAAEELGSESVLLFDPGLAPSILADRILSFVHSNPIAAFRLQVRTGLTWRALFRRQIEPLLEGPAR